MRLTALLSALVLVCAPVEVSAEVVGVALDAKVKLVDGTAVVVDRAQDDGAAFFRLDDAGLTPLGQVALPTSYLGVPASVAVSPDERLALVSASVRLSSTHPKRYIEDDTLSVVDLVAKVPKLVQTLHLGISPSSVTFHPDGSWALVTSNPGNALSILRRRGQRIELGPTLTMPDGAGPLSASFSPNGQWLLVTHADGQRIALYKVRGGLPEFPPVREMVAGVTPFVVSFCGQGELAVVSNFGNPTDGNGDIDTVSLIDMTGPLPRVVDTVSVGSAPEDVSCAADGRYAVVSAQNMSNRPTTHSWYSPHSLLVLLEIEGNRMRRVDQARFGGWGEGARIACDSRTVLTQSITGQSIELFRIEGGKLQHWAPAVVFNNAAPVGISMGGC